MKKIILSLAVLASSFAIAQVGIGNTQPKATLDVNKASYTTGEQAGIAVTQLTGQQVVAMTTTDLKAGTLVYATSTSGAIDAVGFWFYNGASWIRVAEGAFFPKLTTSERNALVSPAKGLTIYNLTTNDIQCNLGTPSAPQWALANNFTSEYRSSTKFAMGFDTVNGGYFSSGGLNFSGVGPSGYTYNANPTAISSNGGYVFSDGGSFRLSTFLPATTLNQNATYARENAFVVSNSGNVGIGTPSPQSPLDVRGNVSLNSNTLFFKAAIDNNHRISATGMIDGMNIMGGAGGALYASNGTGLTSTSIVAVWRASGFGIGLGADITPEVRLEVNGAIKIGNQTATGTAPTAGMIRFNSATSTFEGYNGTTWVTF
jgi:hypothetical protein